MAALDRFLARALRSLGLQSDSLAVCLVTNAQMARWNRGFRGKKGATDVLSFPVNGQIRKRSVRGDGLRTAEGSGSRGDKGGRGSRGKPIPLPPHLRGTMGGRERALRRDDGGARETRRRNGFSSTSFTSFASSASYLGDIAIAPVVARENARLFGRTLNDELRILILHGVLHLMGYDHETDNGEMERRERRLRRTLGLA